MAGLRLDLGRIDQDLKAQLEKEQEGELDEMDPLGEYYSLDDQLTPVEKLDKYFQSENLMERDVAVRCVIDAAIFVTSYSDFELILEIVCAMASDHEPLIRIGVLGTVVSLIERNCEFRERDDTPFGQENEDRLYEIPVKMLNDFNQQVRRVSHNCIITLLDDPKGPTNSLISQLCPMMKRCLGKEENYDLRMDTALLISRVSPLFGPELCKLHFIPLLPSLAVDTMFHVRKAFAMCCKELCPSVGEECTEYHILPLFLQLCKDEVWGVRKACADVFMDVSSACSLVSRQDKLTPVFLQLLRDDSRWVRKAAFQCLGPFISTFCVTTSYDEEQSGSSLDLLGDSELLDTSLLGHTDTNPDSHDQPVAIAINKCSSPEVSKSLQTPSKGPKSPSHASSPLSIFSSPSNSIKPLILSPETRQDEFGLFQFWRSPIPNILLDNIDNETEFGSDQNQSESSEKVTISVPETVISSHTLVHNDTDSNKTDFTSLNGDGLTQHVFRNEGDGDSDDETDILTDIKNELLAESERQDGNGITGMRTEDQSERQDGNGSTGMRTEDQGLDDKPILKVVQDNLESGLTSNRTNGLPHSTTGHIHEEEVMSGYHNMENISYHQLNTTSKSVAMDMTLVDGTISEPFSTAGNDQEVVPDELIEMYLSMVDRNKVESIDSDLPFYCAFSFPAVLQTLGASNWSLLKPTFDLLSSDMQWKIRRVLAHSIHEMARILGQEKAVSELLNVVDEYAMKDIDDVKLGILTHLAEFFEILPIDVRQDCFPYILQGLLDTENERNWRYRDLLSEQLILLCDQYDCQFIAEHISPVAVKLAHDRVAQVRETSSRLIGIILQKFDHSQPRSCAELLSQLRKHFACSDRWLLRLLYVKQCDMFLQEKRVNPSVFAVECIPSLISLSRDEVPNIRMAVGKLLHQTLSNTDYFSVNRHFSNKIHSTIQTLQNDSDRDVRYFSGGILEPFPPERNQEVDHVINFVHKRVRSISEGDNKDSRKVEEIKIDITRAASLLHSI